MRERVCVCVCDICVEERSMITKKHIIRKSTRIVERLND